MHTTYEGSSEDCTAWAQAEECGGFSRSTFVTSRKCSATDVRDRYLIGEELGAGATSKVYRAVNQRTGEDVAVKIICKTHVKDHQMLQNEIAIHKGTDHPNILRLLEVFEDDSSLYLVTELCKDGDLTKLLNASSDEYSALTMPEDDAVRLVQQVVNSVQYLHSKGIVHRDLKPSNFLCTDGSSTGSDKKKRILKLADFGVSAYCNEKHRLTRRVGTDGFMAPEILRHQPYNEKADIFSIGCILHMMLIGHPPKQKDCGLYVTSKIRLRFVTPELRDLVESCMQLDPALRPSAQEIYELPLLKRTREKDWVNSARLDAQLLDKMYSYSSFPLLKKAALVAMVSRAESDSNFSNCIEKFMSLEGATTQGVTVEDMYNALADELMADMEIQAQELINPAPAKRSVKASTAVGAPVRRASARRGRRSSSCPAPLDERLPDGPARAGRERFRQQLRQKAEDLVHKIDVDDTSIISYSEWLAATVDPSWYQNRRRIKATFRLFDMDGDGIISEEDLKNVIPKAFKTVNVREVLLESQHCAVQQAQNGVSEKDFALLLGTHRPSKYTLTRIRDGLEDPLLPS